MALLALQSISKAGLNPAFVAAGAGGDTFANDGSTSLHVKNGGAGAITVTVASDKLCDQGFDHDVAVNVPIGGERIIGPFRPKRFGGIAAVSYSGVTTVTVAAFQLPR